jgi:hypothetical protein
VRDTAAHFSERSGELFTPADIREMIRKQAATFVDEQNTGNTFIKDLLFHAEAMKSELVPRSWQVWEAPSGSEFVTSDNPVVTFVRLREDLWHPGYGTRRPGVVVALPLATTACLIIGLDDKPEFKTVDSASVNRMNEVVISSCDRFVYSKTKSQDVADMVDSIGGWSVPGKTAFIGGAEVGTEQTEDYLRAKMRIGRLATAPPVRKT